MRQEGEGGVRLRSRVVVVGVVLRIPPSVPVLAGPVALVEAGSSPRVALAAGGHKTMGDVVVGCVDCCSEPAKAKPDVRRFCSIGCDLRGTKLRRRY